MKLNQDQINEYVKSGGEACPYCGSKEIEGLGNMEMDGDYAWMIIQCQHCNMEWQDSYRLVGILEMHEGPFSDMIERENK